MKIILIFSYQLVLYFFKLYCINSLRHLAANTITHDFFTFIPFFLLLKNAERRDECSELCTKVNDASKILVMSLLHFALMDLQKMNHFVNADSDKAYIRTRAKRFTKALLNHQVQNFNRFFFCLKSHHHLGAIIMFRLRVLL